MTLIDDPFTFDDSRAIDVDSLNGLFSDQEFKLGYARAKNEVLATHPLLIEQFIRARGIDSKELQQLLRSFGRFVDDEVDQYLPSSGEYVSDGLGI